jgi:hypothetical protein
MDMNCNECLGLLSDQFVHVFEAHLGKSFHDSYNFSLFLLEFLKFFFLTFLKAFLDFVSPKSLDTEKGNLRWISCDKVLKTHREAVLATSLGYRSNRSLHFVLKLD